MSLKSNRRDFLRAAALGVGTLGLGELLASRLFRHITLSAYAQSTYAVNAGGYYFHISMPGGPPRWFFDLPLTPMGTTATNVRTPGFGTAFEQAGSAMNVVYRAIQKASGGSNLYLPPVWGYHTSKNFDSLLNHCLFVRGMNMEIDSHAVSNQRQVAPVIGGLSLSGAVADKSDRPLHSIVDGLSGAAMGYKSARGLAPTTFTPSGNPLIQVLAPFARLPASRPHIQGQNLMLQEQILTQIENSLLESGYPESNVADAYNKAAGLIDNSIQNLAGEFPAVRDKYKSLIETAMSPSKGSLPGLFDKAIPINKSSTQFQAGLNILPSQMKISDLRDMMGSTVQIRRMAESFAVMEILVDRLSTNFSVSLLGPDGVTYGSTPIGITHDQHYVGKHVATLTTTLYYRSLLSCLAEFVDVLKQKNIFDKSVIHIGSEFNRIPRNDGSGADHGPQGSNATLISGKFNRAHVIGNILIEGTGRGTWGQSAPYSLVKRYIKVNDVARSVSAMLGIADVVTNGTALVAPGTGGFWVPKKVEANNV